MDYFTFLWIEEVNKSQCLDAPYQGNDLNKFENNCYGLYAAYFNRFIYSIGYNFNIKVPECVL